MARYIEFHSDEGNFVARARLWDERAPRTCALVWDMLPLAANLHHAAYSGAELALILPDYLPIERENATVACLPWELGFASLRAADYIDVDEDFSEIMFFYDRNTGPRMLDGLVPVNLFGEFETGQDALRRLAKVIRWEGRRPIRLRRSEA